MTRRLTELGRGLVALAATIGLLAAVPYALYSIGGSPGRDLLRAVTEELTSDNTRTRLLLGGGLVLIAWLCWAQLAYALTVEIAATLRGGVARTVPLLPGIQAFAARLVASATLITTSLMPRVPAFAAPLTPDATVLFEFSAPAINQPDRHLATIAAATPRSAAAMGSTYVVQERDTFWNLADRFLGDGLRWRELRDTNLGHTMADGTIINDTTETPQPGWTLALPSGAVPLLATTEPTDVATASVHAMVDVEAGDHFWGLAEDAITAAWGREPSDQELAPFWSDMVEHNRDRLLPPEEPNLIYPGQRFALPTLPMTPKPRRNPAI